MRAQAVRQATPGVTDLSRARVPIDLAVWYIAVGLGYPGGAFASKGWVVHPLKAYMSWVHVVYASRVNLKVFPTYNIFVKKIGDEPKIILNLNRFEFPTDLRVILPIGKFKRIIKTNSIDIKKISESQGISTKVVYHYLNGKRNPKLSFIKKVVDENTVDILLKTNKVKFGDGGNAATCIFPSYLNPKLAYLVGALRDGNINCCGKYELSYTQKNQVWLKRLSKLILKTFNPSNKPRLIIREKNTPKITISNKPICEFLKIVFEIPIGDKEQWATPKIILDCPKEIQKYYIRGYFDADGICGKHVGFCQINLQSLKEIKKILKKFNISCTNTISARKLKSGKMFYSLYIKKEHWNNFFKIIGSSNPSKFTRFVQN